MREQKKNLKNLCIGKDWTLFLDRDGVINKKIEGDYVRSWSQFEFIDGAIEGLKILRKIFGRIIIVTNQRGIGLGLMTENDLHKIHENMQKILQENGVFIDKIYYCPHDYQKENCDCRKPKVGLALKAKMDFPEIDFKKSIILGDSISDIEFGKSLGMITVFINQNCDFSSDLADLCFKNILEFALAVSKKE
ncbi:MAG: HAD family hydrolase [Candidatus Calescibacterium sp.]|jgi:D-glycero-D-manno-heptose 1,7-bisphosphate phosphatase|nr:HAD family hydrolase [Candidatus Calescibacterium sp.]